MSMGCADQTPPTSEDETAERYPLGTFGYDLNFLNEKGKMLVLADASGEAQIVVSPDYQGKVFTSTAEGLSGKSFGWINYTALNADTLDLHMNAYGGEDRMWLGPEGGPFSIFFPPGADMVFDNWKTPAAIDSEAWDLVTADSTAISMKKDMELLNYAGTKLKLQAARTVELLSKKQVGESLGIAIDETAKLVAFKTTNAITNTGDFEWTKETGTVCIWNLDMLTPSPEVVVAMPYKEGSEQKLGKIATTNYFGEIPEDRIKYENGVLYFKADGRSRGKLGLSPKRATQLAGSYDATNHVLTIALFDLHPAAEYMNQEWKLMEQPFQGDAVNSYNDGPLEDGSQMGPFYEIESVSPAAFLKSGERLVHQHSLFHFVGTPEELDVIATELFGVGVEEMSAAF